ncbi:MAG: S8 family serine peptidase [Anaerotignum sp.]|nr:S8 family serine peptidase [Anaerotignum sp.]
MYATHVTGIASGNGTLSNGRYMGIAPQAHIISLKILDRHGQGSSSHAVAALRWIMDNSAKYNIKVVNLSIGSNDKKVNQPLKESVEALWHKGIVVVAAAGNPDGRRGYQPPPPISPMVITVGTWEDRDYFIRNKPFSFFTRDFFHLPDIWAPGENIVSVLSPDYQFSMPNRSRENIIYPNYISMSGASMATPLVSGAAALLFQRFSNVRPNNVKAALIKIATENGGLLDQKTCLNETGKVVLA